MYPITIKRMVIWKNENLVNKRSFSSNVRKKIHQHLLRDQSSVSFIMAIASRSWS